MPRTRTIILILTLGAIAASVVLLERRKPAPTTVGAADIPLKSTPLIAEEADGKEQQVKPGELAKIQAALKNKVARYPRAKEIVSPAGFINSSDSLRIANLIGKKIILVDFWTYSCINCQRTLPYLNQWYQQYHDQGLEIIGIHTPEFAFEKDRANVEAAVKKYNVQYPVVQDNDRATWSAYQNNYWPRKYLIDADGFIVYDHIGEGGYEETEQKIQDLLVELRTRLGMRETSTPTFTKPAGAVDVTFDKVGSPETYFGSVRNNLLANGDPGKNGEQTLEVRGAVPSNALLLEGRWSFSPEFAENKTADARIVYRYLAKHVYFVASGEGGIGGEEGTEVEILRDGKSLGGAAGKDVREVDGASRATIKESRLYELINDPDGYGTHTIEIIIKQGNLRAFTFTFG